MHDVLEECKYNEILKKKNYFPFVLKSFTQWVEPRALNVNKPNRLYISISKIAQKLVYNL